MNKLKKLLTTGILSLGVLIGTSTSAFADVSGWQTSNYDTFRYDGSPSVWAEYWGSRSGHSGWARLKIPVYTPSNNSYNPEVRITIWEGDEAGNAPEKVGTWYIRGNHTNETIIDVDISKYVDGTNKQAELYATYLFNFSTSISRTNTWYD